MLNHKLWLSQLTQGLKTQAHSRRSKRSRSARTERLEAREVLSASPIGSEFLVNTTTLLNQQNSQVAMDADGDFVTVWQSANQDGGGWGVYAQRYNAAGVSQGAEFRVNTFTTSDQQHPSVAIDADGDFVVAWSSDTQDGSGTGIYAQRYNAAGVAIGNEFRVNSFTTGHQSSPSVAIDVDGDFVVTWSSEAQDGDQGGIYAKRYNAAGVVQGNEFRVNSFTTGNQSLPSTAMDAAGDFVITWQSIGQNGSLRDIYAQRYNTAGVALGTEFRVNSNTVTQKSEPRIASDRDGDFIITWSSLDQLGDDIYAQRYSNAGLPLGSEFRVNTDTIGEQLSPAVAMDSDGDFIVTWNSWATGQTPGDGFEIFAQQYNNAGVATGAAFRVNSNFFDEQSEASVAMDSDGDFIVTWRSTLPNDFDVHAQRFDESTTSAGPIVTEVRDLDRRIAPSGRLTTTLGTLTVVFSEDMNVVGGASGANSVLNPANWQLTNDGFNVSSLIAGVTFEPNDETGKFEAELTLSAPLTSGTFQLTVRDTIHGITGNALDGDLNGTLGGKHEHSFAIESVQSAGSGFHVNPLTLLYQFDSAVALNAGGDYVVTWTNVDGNGSDSDIYAQRYNATGTAKGNQFRVNTFTTGLQRYSAVAMDTDGDFVVTWQSYGQEGNVSGVYGQRYDAAGAKQGGEFRVNTNTNGSAHPTVAMDTDGDFVVAWQSVGQDGSHFGIFAQRYNPAGVAQGSEFQVNTFTTDDQRHPSLSMDADGDFVVTWDSNGQDGSSYGIFAQRYNTAGVAQGGEFRVNTFTTDNQRYPTVAMDADGDFVVTWQSLGQEVNRYGIYAQRFNAAGLAQGDELRVNTFTTDNQRHPTVAMDADGDFVVTWEIQNVDTNNYGINAQRYNAAGSGQGGEFRVITLTAITQPTPAVAMKPDGDFVVTWQSEGHNFVHVQAQRYQSDATVRMSSGVLTVTGSTAADVMTVERITPAGSLAYLNAVRNGVNYTFDPAKVTNIVMNGSTGDDRLAIGKSLNIPATLNGDGGNDTLMGGAANDILNGGTGNDFYLFDTDTALGFDVVTDVSGVDTFDFSTTETLAVSANLGLNSTQVVNANHSLRLSSVNAIENIIGGALGDTLTGNARPNRLTGGRGNDLLNGGAGNDTYVFDADSVLGADTLNEAGGGIDTLDFSATTTRNIAADLSSSLTQTVAAGFLTLNLSAKNTFENVIGGSLHDMLTGNILNNSLTGGPGNDTYYFNTDLSLGNDSIHDVNGIDTLNFGATNGQSITVDLSSSAAQVVTPLNLTLTLSSSASIENVVGGSLGDTLTGNNLANTLMGLGGNDTLRGGDGADIYRFDTDLASGSDTISDAGGTDTLDFSTTTTRAVVVDLSSVALQVVNAGLSLTLDSSTSIENMIGGSLGDTLTGSSLANTITGGPGNDIMTGGGGNDCYKFAANVNLGTDTINEAGGGVDTLDFGATTSQAIAVDLSNAASQAVSSTLSLVLSAGDTIENIIGGALDDTLIGNTLANALTGGAGNDSLTGAAGDDVYLFNTDLVLGSDTINEAGGGIDTLDFSSTLNNAVAVDLGNAASQTVTAGRLTLTLSANNTIENVVGGALGDTLSGNTLSNRLTGGAGNDVLAGGAGNDIYVFDTDLALGTDTIDESSGGVDTLTFVATTTRAVAVDLSNAGTQIVNAGLSLNLLSATTLENVIGGSLDDTLTGNTLANTLAGGAGSDLLLGGTGDDSYSFDTDTALGHDTIVETGGIDRLDFSLTTTVAVEVDLSLATRQIVNANLTLTLSAINAMENATGGALNDVLIGNSLANTLIGNDGDDVLSGRAGNDILTGGNGKNILIGGDGADRLTGGTSEDLLLGARYVYENDLVALEALRAEWTSASNFDDRTGHLLGTLAGGANDGFTLTRSTVKEDSSADTLLGGSGRDWYLRNSLGTPNIFRDTLTDADLDSLFTEIDTWF